MLIRTKASQVVPIFNDFMKFYPNLKAFLNSKSEVLHKFFHSLGLLFRANFLDVIVKQIKNEFNNQIPNSFTDLKSLKGIGKYSANAILCFGFYKRRPILDSNFIRIYSRVFNIKAKTKTPKADKFLWQFSKSLLPEIDFVNFNYSVLDLGGNICISRNPKCNICPLKLICDYFKKTSI